VTIRSFEEPLIMSFNWLALFSPRNLARPAVSRNFSAVSASAGGASLVAAALAVAACFVPAHPVAAQTVLYDGSQTLNFFSASHLRDDLALPKIIEAGTDPAVLEAGDGAWFRSSGRRMRNTSLGSAGAAPGVDGEFMSSLFDASGTTVDPGDDNGVGAGFVVYDAKATTGLQKLNISLYYNDVTPNNVDPSQNGNGGSVAIRVVGLQSTGDAADPWSDDEFTFLASNGFAAGFISAANHRPNNNLVAMEPVVDRLFFADSSFDTNGNPDAILLPGPDWQNLSFQFDAGTGYDYLIFAVGGVVQDDNTLGIDRFGFDNISFEPAPLPDGDFDGDLDVDGTDFLVWQRSDGTAAGFNAWQENFGVPALVGAMASVPEPCTASLMMLTAVGLLARWLAPKK
jgi:hypothetical protein